MDQQLSASEIMEGGCYGRKDILRLKCHFVVYHCQMGLPKCYAACNI